MRDPVVLAARNPCPPGKSCVHWALEVFVRIHAGKNASRRSIGRTASLSALSPCYLVELRRRNIAAYLENYGNDWSRFETELTNETRRHPVVSVPTSAMVDWQTGSLRIRSQTFVVSYEGSDPVFLTCEPHSRKILKVTLAQMRLLHRTWREWPGVLPSMLLNVLWHSPLRE